MNERLLETKSADDRHGLRRVGIFFRIFSSIANVGNERPLVAEDVPVFHTSSQSHKSLEEILKTASRRRCCPTSTDSISDSARFYSARKLFLFLLSHKWLSYLYLNFLKLLSCVLSFISPVLLGKFVEYFDDDDAELYRGILLLIILLVSQLFSTILSSQFNIQATMMETELKGAFYLGVFKLSLAFRVHESTSRSLTNGQIMNVLQIDVDRSIETLKSFIDLWSIPLQVVIAFLLLYYQVNIAFIAGVAAIVLMIPLNSFIARKIGIATSQLMKHKDLRLSILGEAFKGILGLKSSGLEKDISRVASDYRYAEVKCLSTRKYLDAWCVLLWATMPIIVPYCTFMVTIALGRELSSSKVLTTIALLNMLIFPMNAFPWVLNGIMEGIVSASRVMKIVYSHKEDRFFYFPERNTEISSSVSARSLFVKSVVLKWESPEENGNGVFVRGPLNAKCSAADHLVVLGDVASGKTTFLMACLQEIPCSSGVVDVGTLWMAYCGQVPTLHRASIQENIILNSPFDLARYNSIIRGCCLDEDFSAVSLRATGGDRTILAHGAKNLSGGQKQRLAIARAIYSSAPVVLLDDPFSALDCVVAEKVCKFVVDFCAEESRVLVVTTQSLAFFPYAVNILNMSVREVAVSRLGSSLLASLRDERVEEFEFVEGIVSLVNMGDISIDDGILSVVEDVDMAVDTESAPESQENVKTGHIRGKVWLLYFKAMGFCTTIMILFATAVMQVTANLNGLWLVHWSQNSDSISTSEFIKVSTFFLVVNLLGALFRSFLFAKGCLTAAVELYNNLIASLFNCPVGFFENISFGQISNRIGQDTNVIDDQLPFVLNIVLAQLFVILGTVSMMMYIIPPIIVVLLLSLVLYNRLQRFYRSSSRQMRRLESAARSPVYSLFIECLDDGPTIRGLKAELYFESTFSPLVNSLLKISLFRNIGTQWLNLRLQMIGSFISTSVALFAIICSTYNIFSIDGAQFGLALIYSLNVVNNLNGLVSSFADTEQAMISVERVLEYVSLDQEGTRVDKKSGFSSTAEESIKSPLLGIADKLQIVPSNWPADGTIIFTSVFMSYQPSLPPALRGITLNIQSGRRVAVVGRTGSGKSSILRVLLRLNEYSGSVLFSGCELRDISPSVVREAVTVIPQDPLVFTGTIAFNLDPGKQHTRDKLREVLEGVGLHLELCSAKSDLAHDLTDIDSCLDFSITNGGANLSQGQRQLLCLGRAMLKSSKIILIDEATASLDENLETVFFGVLKTCFPSATIILISHKIETAFKFCDEIVELSDGVVLTNRNLH